LAIGYFSGSALPTTITECNFGSLIDISINYPLAGLLTIVPIILNENPVFALAISSKLGKVSSTTI